jgi:8-oxo-dGTP pyrophosphatase MutT (NUDIX family)
MKLSFKLPDDGAVHRYCMSCHTEGVKTVRQDDRVLFYCPACQAANPRMIYNGATKHWTAADGTWWHESAGVFVRGEAGKFLFFELTAFPFGFTVPAGHVDKGEEPDVAAARELEEEVGIQPKHLRHVASLDIPGDSCSGGCDDHRWHVYMERDHPGGDVTVVDEGKNPVWLTLDEALGKELPVPIRTIIEKYQQDLEAD